MSYVTKPYRLLTNWRKVTITRDVAIPFFGTSRISSAANSLSNNSTQNEALSRPQNKRSLSRKSKHVVPRCYFRITSPFDSIGAGIWRSGATPLLSLPFLLMTKFARDLYWQRELPVKMCQGWAFLVAAPKPCPKKRKERKKGNKIPNKWFHGQWQKCIFFPSCCKHEKPRYFPSIYNGWIAEIFSTEWVISAQRF